MCAYATPPGGIVATFIESCFAPTFFPDKPVLYRIPFHPRVVSAPRMTKMPSFPSTFALRSVASSAITFSLGVCCSYSIRSRGDPALPISARRCRNDSGGRVAGTSSATPRRLGAHRLATMREMGFSSRRSKHRGISRALITSIVMSITIDCALTPRSVVPRMASALIIVVDTAGEGGPNAHLYVPVAGVITIVEGRGRFDVTSNRGGPALGVGGVKVDAPLGAPGDYYLFDSTGCTLVHPATRTFARYVIGDDSYNFVESREGWPE